MLKMLVILRLTDRRRGSPFGCGAVFRKGDNAVLVGDTIIESASIPLKEIAYLVAQICFC